MMADLFGTTPGVFLGVTVVLMGGAGFMAGQALGENWRPMWQLGPYALLLGLADRFLACTLFGQNILSVPGYVLDTVVIGMIALVAYRATRARKMVIQYPWLYERAGVFEWRDRK